MKRPLLLHPAVKPLAHALCALPLLGLVAALLTQGLGANPAEALIRGLGDWGLRGLLLTLAITPLRVTFHQPALLRLRRLLGLWSFAYVALHLTAYAWFDQGLVLQDIVRDVLKRPFILVGMLAFLLMLPLALTSVNAAVRALGGRRWQALHRLVYAVAALGCLHFWWMRSAKNNLADPFFHAALLALLLGWRLWHRWRQR
ncbi:MAG: sulfoxide reductase heme-binding subunit YedZ [Inhella sp.]|uniref:sulfite oxidase heme-binding subunit YedZ n=1 Tax=Inhella sp. TaxID=1921806 RepID=UPI0022C5B56A|nr:protein-methionine-sulfoxide reductase heme-binding subunit MsrQ [Inhella sp.]MCZ8233574.1 sulfoxide reductase heme-binding subunit YedZ [Inhella sp.]